MPGDKAVAIIFNHQSNFRWMIDGADDQPAGMPVLDGIGNGLMPDAKKAIEDAKGDGAGLAFYRCFDLHRMSSYHLQRNLLQRRDQAPGFRGIRTKRSNAASGFIMTVPHQLGCAVQLFEQRGFVRRTAVFRDTVANCTELKADSRKTLRQSVVDLMRQPLPFINDRP